MSALGLVHVVSDNKIFENRILENLTMYYGSVTCKIHAKHNVHENMLNLNWYSVSCYTLNSKYALYVLKQFVACLLSVGF